MPLRPSPFGSETSPIVLFITSQDHVSVNGVELQDREFFDAICENREA